MAESLGSNVFSGSQLISPLASLNSQSFERLDSLWTCIGCGVPVRDLYCLPCLHPLALCAAPECVEKVRRNKVNCPDCEEMFTIQPETLSWQLFATRKAQERMSRMCSSNTNCQEDHEGDRAATSFCMQCSSSLCGDCGEQHRKMIASRDHEILELPLSSSPTEDRHDESCSESVPSVAIVCSEHSKTATLFCYKCDSLVCDLCVSLSGGKHNHHKVSLLDRPLIKEQNSYIVSYYKSTKNVTQKLTNASMMIAESKEVLAEKRDQAKSMIHHMADELINGIVTRRDELCEDVDQIAHTKEDQLEARHREIASILRRFVQFQKVSKMLLEEGSAWEQLVIKRNYFERVKSLHAMAHKVPLNPTVSPSLEFFRNDTVTHVQGRIHALGYVSSGPDPQLCTVQFYGCLCLQDSVRMLPHDPLWFVMQTRNRNHEECRHGGDTVKAVLVPVTTGVALKGYTEDLEDGTYRFSFPGVPAEECLLNVSINGQQISNVPKFCRFLDYSCKYVISTKQFGFGRPTSLALSRSGTLAVTDEKKNQICIFSLHGKLIKVLGMGRGKEVGQFQEWMRGVAFNSRGFMAVSDSDNGRIQLYDPTGRFVRLIGEEHLKDPRSLAFNSSDHLVVVDKNKILFFTENGELLKCFNHLDPTTKRKLHQFALGPGDEIFMIDKESTSILVLSKEGELVRSFGTYGHQRGQLHVPCGIAATRDGFVIVTSHHKVSIFKMDGKFVQEIAQKGDGIGSVHSPFGVVVDGRGYIYVADRNNHRIQVF